MEEINDLFSSHILIMAKSKRIGFESQRFVSLQIDLYRICIWTWTVHRHTIKSGRGRDTHPYLESEQAQTATELTKFWWHGRRKAPLSFPLFNCSNIAQDFPLLPWHHDPNTFTRQQGADNPFPSLFGANTPFSFSTNTWSESAFAILTSLKN